MVVEIVDPVADYAALMERLFDFDRIRAMLRGGFRIRFDAMHAVTGPYAREILERRPLDESRPDLGMAAHLVRLLVAEWPRVTDDHVGDPDLADVVQEAGEPDARAALIVEAELPRGPIRIARHGL